MTDQLSIYLYCLHTSYTYSTLIKYWRIRCWVVMFFVLKTAIITTVIWTGSCILLSFKSDNCRYQLTGKSILYSYPILRRLCIVLIAIQKWEWTKKPFYDDTCSLYFYILCAGDHIHVDNPDVGRQSIECISGKVRKFWRYFGDIF